MPPDDLKSWAEIWWEEEEYDTPEEVEAAFRAKRRLSFLYGGLFFLVTLAIPVLNITWHGWTTTEVWGGLTVAYLAVQLFYPAACILLGIAYTLQVNRVEDALLGRSVPGQRDD